jgi:hypothetical protein
VKQKNKKRGTMKKFIIPVLLLFVFFGIATNAYCDDDDLDGEINIKIGIDLKKQSHSLSYGKIKETDAGFSLGIENLVPVYNNIRCGGGLEYCAFPAKINTMALSALAIYATLKITPFTNSQKTHLRKVYLKTNLGYSKALLRFENLFSGGSLYFAIGPGIETKKGIFFELKGSLYNSLSETSSNIGDIDTSFFKFGLDIGYKFKDFLNFGEF